MAKIREEHQYKVLKNLPLWETDQSYDNNLYKDEIAELIEIAAHGRDASSLYKFRTARLEWC